MREQISSLERDKIWLRDRLDGIVVTSDISVPDPVDPEELFELMNKNNVELPSMKRRRLEEKYRLKNRTQKEPIDG